MSDLTTPVPSPSTVPSPFPGVRAASSAPVTVTSDLVLLVRRKPDDYMGGLWEIPSGHVDAGESILDETGPVILTEHDLHQWTALAGDLPGVTDGVREVLACA
ncbi:NUDIX domain-containing protein [Streptomyces lydicus]|uniref:NUDIX domain-containing protein n=1 Tax=Streptomyces lydicus TaxID=47763 RepID=UPI0036F71207